MQEKLKRLSDETLEAYNYRICRNKDIGKYELTWEEVRDILNTENNVVYGESKWRKDYQVIQKYLDNVQVKSVQDQEILEEIRLAKLELELAKKEKQTEAIYYNRVLREHARQDMIHERVIDAVENADKIPLPKFEALQSKKHGKSEYLLGVSDVHAYKMFKSITNEFNKQILEDRMAQLILDVKEVVEEQGIEELTILNGGDSLEGLLRLSALGILELGVVDTIVEFRRFMASWLKEISVFVKVKYIHLTSANHSEYRPFSTRAGQFPHEDFEKDLATYIQDILSDNDRIEVIVPRDMFHRFNMCGYEIIAHHGHGIKSPTNYITKMTRKLRVFLDYAIFGHLHKESILPVDEGETNDCEILRLPSIVGTDTYADTLLVGSKASAVMFRFTEGRGRDREFKFILN